MISGFREPRAEKAPAAKIRLSPGKKGVKTKPVSQKIIINKIRLVRTP